MTSERHALIKRIFLAACSVPLEARDELLRTRCGGDDELRREVEKLLDHHVPGTQRPDPTASAAPNRPADGHGHAEPLEPEAPRFQSGAVLADRYRIVAPLGHGGMGEVYRADDLTLDQTVALKFLWPELATNPVWLSRLHAEVRMARQVTHAHVCRVYDLGEAQDNPFISMEYVDGEDLATLIMRIGRLAHDKACQIGRQICFGLAAAHDRGVLHRDLKPSNIMLDGRGSVRITDFGLAGLAGDLRGAERYAGTPAYMAPEQFAGKGASVKTDLYALGLVLYELFTGRRAFQADQISDYVRLHQTASPALPSDLVEDVDPSVESIILRCLEKEPRDRPASATEVAAALSGGDLLAAALDAGETPSPEMVAAAAPSTVTARTSTALMAAAITMLVVFAIAGRAKDVLWDAATLKPPQVLAEKARETIEAAGYPRHARASAFGFCATGDALALLPVGFRAGDESVHFATAPGNEVLFWYRQSERPLAASDVSNVVFNNARVTLTDPVAREPGDLAVAFDVSGRLVFFAAVPRTAPIRLSAAQVDVLEPLIRHAGFQPTALESLPSAPTWMAHTHAVSTWHGTHPQDDAVAICVLAAAEGVSPVLFAVLQVEEPVAQRFYVSRVWRDAVVRGAPDALLAVLAMVAIPWAWRNLHARRADQMGAIKLAAFVFALRMVVWLLQAGHVTVLAEEFTFLTVAVLRAVSQAVLVGLLYVALEPHARRRWPHLMIAWNRILAFNRRDRILGQHVLIGALLGVYWALLVSFDILLVEWLGWARRPPLIKAEHLALLSGGRHALAACLDALNQALYQGLLYVMLLVGLLTLVRSRRWAVVLTALILAPIFTPQGAHQGLALLTIGLGGVAVSAWVMVRFGLLALASGIFVAKILLAFPTGLGAGVWYTDLTLFALAVAAATAVCGFLAANFGPADKPAL